MIKYTIRTGDNLFSIAKQFSTTVDDILDLNPGIRTIGPGIVLSVPEEITLLGAPPGISPSDRPYLEQPYIPKLPAPGDPAPKLPITIKPGVPTGPQPKIPSPIGGGQPALPMPEKPIYYSPKKEKKGGTKSLPKAYVYPRSFVRAGVRGIRVPMQRLDAAWINPLRWRI
jgi:LysM repeat protein